MKLDEASPIANSVRREDMSQGNLQRPYRQFHGVRIHAVVTKSSSGAKKLLAASIPEVAPYHLGPSG